MDWVHEVWSQQFLLFSTGLLTTLQGTVHPTTPLQCILLVRVKLQYTWAAYSEHILLPRQLAFTLREHCTLPHLLSDKQSSNNFFSIPEYILFRSQCRLLVLRHRLMGCGIHILRGCFLFFFKNSRKRPSNFLSQTTICSGATLSECTFQESAHHLEFSRALHDFST